MVGPRLQWVVFAVLTLFSEGTFMHVRRILSLTLVVPLLLAGCSDEPEPTPKIPEPDDLLAQSDGK